MDYTDRTSWKVKENLRLFYETDVYLVERYFGRYKSLFIYYALFLLLLVFLFIYLKKKVAGQKVVLNNPFEIAVKQIISKPVSTAFIIGLFMTTFIFPNRPLIFIDLMILLVSVPLIMIFSTTGSKMKYRYIYLFFFILVLRFLNFIFLPESLLHRLILLLMGSGEVIFFLGLLRYLKSREVRNALLRNFINLFIIVHIVLAGFGIAGDIYGSVLMADQAMNLVVADAFSGFLIFISAVILVGLLHFAIDSHYLKQLNVIRKNDNYLKALISGWIGFLAIITWLWSILAAMGLNTQFYAWLTQTLSHEYVSGTNSFTIGSILLFFVIIWASMAISRVVSVIMEEDILDKLSLKKGVPRMLAVMTRYTLILIGVFVAVNVAGMSLSSLTIIVGAFSVGIGFGLQNIFNNLVSGLILLFERPIQIGDVVEVGSLLGSVKSMGIRSSNLRTFDGAEVIVPNGHLISNEVINWTLTDKRRRIEILVGVAYGSDVHHVQSLFLKILDGHPDILKEPKPNVYFNDLGESSLDFRLLFWTDNFDEWMRIRSEVIFTIYDLLNAEGIVIPFPQRDVHIRTRGEGA